MHCMNRNRNRDQICLHLMVELVAVLECCLMAFVTVPLMVCFVLLFPVNFLLVSMLCIDLCSQMEVCNCLILQDLLKILVLPVLRKH